MQIRLHIRLAWLLAIALLLAACRAPAATLAPEAPPTTGSVSPAGPRSTPTAATAAHTSTPGATASPTPGDIATPTQPTVAATTTATASLSTALPAAQPVTIPTSDGASLQGTQFGAGSMAVIFANMSDARQESWQDMAQAVADRGYLGLTFDFRYWENGRINPALQDLAAQDLLAVVDYARQQGAQQVVLVGASLGGMAAIKAGLVAEPAAVIVLAAPLEWPDWPSLRVSLEDIQNLAAPILFVNSEGDRFAPDTQEMYEAALQPKELRFFSGDAHGTDLFRSGHAAGLEELLIAFLEAHAPPNQE